jgi:hypothetical protein
MLREPDWALQGDGKVLHVVGCVSDQVIGFLGPATAALARSGRAQAVVMIDEPRYRHHVARLDTTAELVLTPALRNPVARWHALYRACRQALSGAAFHTVHLHGLLPYLAGVGAVRAEGTRAALVYSPHGSRSLGELRGAGTLTWLLARPLANPARHAAIMTAPQEGSAFPGWGSSELVENPVADTFFALARNEARHPLVVAGGSDLNVRALELFAQIAVLMSGDTLRAGFNWIGAVDAVSRDRLGAAGVGVFGARDDADHATRLEGAWLYVAPGAARGFPVFLATAMAAGLPCVALDCAPHREFLREGETGFLCRTEHDMIERIAELIDSAALRARMGMAARQAARLRFGEQAFESRLLAAYALPV